MCHFALGPRHRRRQGQLTDVLTCIWTSGAWQFFGWSRAGVIRRRFADRMCEPSDCVYARFPKRPNWSASEGDVSKTYQVVTVGLCGFRKL